MSSEICYHHNDLDGIASAAIVKLKYPDCEFVEAEVLEVLINIATYQSQQEDEVNNSFSL